MQTKQTKQTKQTSKNFRNLILSIVAASSILTLTACGDNEAQRQAKIQEQQQKIQAQQLELQQKQIISMQEQQIRAQQEAIRQAESGLARQPSQAPSQTSQNASVAQNYGQPAPTPQVVVQSAPAASNSASDALLVGAVGAAAGALAMNAYRDSKVQPVPQQNSSLNGSYATGSNPYRPSQAQPVTQPQKPTPVYSNSMIGSKVAEVKPEVKPEVKAPTQGLTVAGTPAKVQPSFGSTSYSSVKQSAPVYSSSYRSSGSSSTYTRK